MIWLRSSVVLLIFLTLITGVAYPLLATGLSELLFPYQAQGSMVKHDGQTVGSELIGQPFTKAIYFQGRPSATVDYPYNTMASGGSDLATSNPILDDEIKRRVEQLRQFNRQPDIPVPVDLVTASASGLDPHISPAAADFQAQRVAEARRLPVKVIKQLIRDNIEPPPSEFLGEPVINVLKLNFALDNLQKKKQ
ncbi:potassium-transporting ATPase subunit C [Photorhabdus luminescens subsp. luminescens]|uniref:Potassium-transporting ATPase KdpC subunit n=1 Tax=Photorhabdus luminescens TaxID=29488 RepID=A0A1G5R384_PHOLU|nr:potassium-transporting ATPase subunit KdpC [Photorhabdus luminescens]KMW72844.1 potassium-transporting ATPase subunit C [Photorhabdus luminescens subsp. luminescens]MCW7763592.1 potassium-transporting ATPase subunit KdpC [Photorhabdus luminescens subsp. venezuelensis]SCZ68565.1 K+-transporting ATPase ATPase C chain [Photorhabdus luminescens]